MKLLPLIFILISVYYVECNRQRPILTLQQLQNQCLTYHTIPGSKDKTCSTQQKVKMHMASVDNGVYFCISYKKASGDAYNSYDVITINMHHDYDLQYSGANVIDYENLSFKVYTGMEYNARFAIYSNNTEFRIYAVTINGVPQFCNYGKKGGRVWPHGNKTQSADSESGSEIPNGEQIEQNQFQAAVTEKLNERREPTTPDNREINPSIDDRREPQPPPDRREPTTPKAPKITSPKNSLKAAKNISPENSISSPKSEATCGMVQKMVDLSAFSMPSPGQYPFAASIHQVIDEDENNSVFKCSASIIDQSVILTSVNCLMDANARLMNEDELQVIVAQYSKNSKGPKSRIYEVEQILPHEQFNLKLDYNVAALKLKQNIEFDDFVQPVCLPDKSTSINEGDMAKLVGYGNSCLMTDSDYMISLNDEIDDLNEEPKNPSTLMTFNGNNTSNDINSTSPGNGLYMSNPSSPEQWILIGITSSLPHAISTDCNAVFTNVIFFIDWIDNCINTLGRTSR